VACVTSRNTKKRPLRTGDQSPPFPKRRSVSSFCSRRGPRHDLCWDEVDFVSGKINLLQKGDRQHIVWITTRLAELLRRQEGNRPECVLLMSARGRASIPTPRPASMCCAARGCATNSLRAFSAGGRAAPAGSQHPSYSRERDHARGARCRHRARGGACRRLRTNDGALRARDARRCARHN
jgi:integrase